ncbi:hypothetical protein [Demequina lutea]|uniref:Uncharacterized protein n=1 Tax=Demequina lutea TaxID=431489 RepID=A0A7Y9Z7J5_9MICO|nr:hypothetical protein [Demequina lutea]NYI40269.1 hypothetical protein [Demequina lutea]
MPTLHDLMSQSIDARAAALGAASLTTTDASRAGATRGLISRRRRRNAAVAGGTSALAIGGLVAAVLVQGSRGQVPASTDPNGIQYVKVDMSGSDAWQGFTNPVVSTNCGASLPASKTEDQGFTQSVAVDPAAPDGTLRVNASLNYDGPDRASALINPGSALLTRDGVVINYYPGNNNGAPFGAVASGDTWTNRSVVSGPVFEQRPCFSGVDYVEPNATDVAYPAGDYQVYVVSQAFANPTLLAEHALQAQGYYVAASGSGAWNPGSVDCQRAATSAGGGFTPVQCLDPLPSGVSIDTKSHTATLPYHSADYSGELNVTLISQPIAVTLDHDITYGDLGYVSAPTAQPTSDKPLTCGQFDGPRTLGGSITAKFVQPVSVANLLSGGEVPILVDDMTGNARQRGTLRLADGAIASVVLSDSSSGAWVAAQGTAALTPSVVSVDRAKGYPDVSLKLDGMTECPAPTEGPGSVQKLDSAATSLWLVVQGDLRIDWEDGTTTTSTSITLSGGTEG